MRLFTSLLVCAGALLCADGTSYDNYKLYEVLPHDVANVRRLHSWSEDGGIELWNRPGINRTSTVMVRPDEDDPFREYLRTEAIAHRLVNGNVQTLIDADWQRRTGRRRRSADFTEVDFEHFWKLDEIHGYLDYLATEYPDLVRVFEIGKTYEGRPMKVITVSLNGVVNKRRPVVLMDAGIHAREWAAHMATVHLIYQLVERSADNMDLLLDTDWVILPVANPDGYVYAHEKNRLWRKNRAPTNILCPGTDLNRNFPFRWSYTTNPCTDGYAGRQPASELEVRAMMLLMAEYAQCARVYLAVHTCGDFILYPYGYDYVPAPNSALLQQLGEEAARAVTRIGGPTYAVGNSATLLYPATGSDDFIYGSYGVSVAYTLELSCGANGAGAIIEPSQIRKIAAEAFEMFKVFGTFAGTQTVRSG